MNTSIKKLRQDAGLTQAELADAAGLSQAHISQIESGKAGVGLKAALGIAKALGMPLDRVLVTGEVGEQPATS